MVLHTFDPKRFFRRVDTAALLIPAEEIFGVFNRSFELPRDWCALISGREGDHRLYTGGSRIPADDVLDILFARNFPVEVPIEINELVSKDGYRFNTQLTLRVSIVADAEELNSFRHALLGSHRAATAATIERFLQPACLYALTDFIGNRTAEDILDLDDHDEVQAALLDALKGPCFSAGLTTDAKINIAFDSPTYRHVLITEEEASVRQREQQSHRELQAAIESAQSAHLDHLSSLLARVKELSDQSPAVGIGDLIRTFSEKERGEIYEALWTAHDPARRTQWIVVAAGGDLLYYTPDSPHEPASRIPLPGTVGGLRSIESHRDIDGQWQLLIGASRGVYMLSPLGKLPEQTFSIDHGAPLRGGVNAVDLVGGRLFATHSEIGLACWTMDRPDEAERLLAEATSGARAVRNVCHVDGALYFSVDSRIVKVPVDHIAPDELTYYDGCGDTVTSLWVDPKRVIAGNARGQVVMWEVDAPDAPTVLHGDQHRPVESVCVIESEGVERLIFTDTSTAVRARVIGDNFICRYEAGGQIIRRVEVADDLIVGTNELRDRLMVWNPARPGQPIGITSVARTTGHSVQDVCLLPEMA